MRPGQLTIVGVGLLGGSIGLAVRAAFPECRIIGCGHRQPSLLRAAEMGAIDRGETDPAAAVAGSDLVILCTPIGAFERILKQIAASLKPGCIVTDVGSTKRSVVRLAETILPQNVDFVPSHPMAGGEKRGVEFARADLFHDALCLLTPTDRTRPEALDRVESFWRLLGMRTVRLTPQDHDRRISDVSHLPHLLSAALVAMQEEAALDLCGPGFLDTTRIAAGDPEVWRDIFLDNADHLRDGALRLRAQLDRVMSMLERGQSEGVLAWLEAAAVRRRNLPRKSGQERAS